MPSSKKSGPAKRDQIKTCCDPTTSTDSSTQTSNALTEIQPVDEVVAWLIEGHRDADIRGAIKEKWPEHDPTQLQLQAADHFRRAANCEPQIIVGFAIEAYRDLYRRMVKIGDFAGAARAVKELVALTRHVQRFRETAEGSNIDCPASPQEANGRRRRKRADAGEAEG